MKNTRKDKKKGKSLQTKINWIVSISLIVLLPIAFVHKHLLLKESGVTICKIIGERRRPGSSAFRGKEVIIEYYVNGKCYESVTFKSSVPNTIGDCFKLEYSLKKPQISDTLWDEGKQPCLDE